MQSVSTIDLSARNTSLENTRSATAAAALFAAAFGLFLIWGVGFSPIDAFHNAAHDTRHSNGFPCH